jgi:hypothetical protein
MILDERLEFCDATSVAAVAGTLLEGDVIDLGETTSDVGNGQPIYLVITVDTSIITGGTAGTIRFHLASDAQAAIAVDGSATIHWSSQAFVTDDAALNALDAGYMIGPVALPMGLPLYERYLGLLVEVITTEVTAGAISAGLTFDAAGWRAYPDASN